MRIVGIDLPDKKKIKIALTYIYGIGPKTAVDLLVEAKIDPEKRALELSGDEIAQITKYLGDIKIEGDLRREIGANIRRLKEIGSFRGSRHTKNLPLKGQRTRSNARTKRGKRVTIGALKKEILAKASSTAGAAANKK